MKCAKRRYVLAGIEDLFRSDWPLAKILQRHGDAETGFNNKSDWDRVAALDATTQGLGFRV